MRHVIVRYRVKPDRAAENEQLVRAVYEELAQTGRDDLSYATFKLDDGVSFVHIARMPGNVLPELAAFRAFRENLDERCDVQPIVTEVQPVGAFHAFDG
jgi:hypothetical protein